VRILSAASPNLPELMQKGGFLPDLYYRLESFVIRIPPLRERPEDWGELADYFLKKFATEHQRRVNAFSPEARKLLAAYHWPGNVRELRNVIERAAVLASGPEVDEGLVQTLLPAAVDAGAESLDLEKAVDEAERRAILRALAAAGDRKAEAAALLGIGERTLWTKMKKYGL
jgi:DNA-binding NtrC family response regulator